MENNMKDIANQINNQKRNFVFVGESGSGKSEIALNFSLLLTKIGNKPVHFFDLDMTKPLFRSREAFDDLEKAGIIFHFEDQFMDAPTMVGGVRKLMKDDTCFVVLDVGGDDIGAKALGGFVSELNSEQTVSYYVLNAFRPWSTDIDQIDKTLISVLGASGLNLESIRLVNNPNLGISTTLDDFLEGCRKMNEMVSPYKPIDFTCVNEALFKEARERVETELLSLHLHLTYPWLN